MENIKRVRHKQYDTVFTKKYSWSKNLDILVKRAIIKGSTLVNTSKYPDIVKKDLVNSEVLEVECLFEDYLGEDFNCLKRALVKFAKNDKYYAAIIIFDYDGTVKLVKVSEVKEEFDSNIDVNEVEWTIEDKKFGYFYGDNKSEVIEIGRYGTKQLESNVAMTIEMWNKLQEIKEDPE